MTLGTNILIGGIQLDDADFEWVLYSGGAINPIVIGFDASRIEEFKALPYITTLSITCSGEDGTAAPTMETLVIEGVRVIEVREINELAGELILGDVRVDLARRVWPSDYMMRWRDGYLHDTNKPRFSDAIKYAAGFVPELAAALADDAFAGIPETAEFELPDSVLKAGQLCLPALEQLAQLVGAGLTVGADGKVRFPVQDAAAVFPTASYSWIDAALPSWDVKNRFKRGLPKTFRVYYNERHTIRVAVLNPNTTSSVPLKMAIENVYFFDGRYGPLSELLTFFGFEARAVSEAQIARMYTSDNFESTAIARDGSAEADDIIAIVKRDWRQLWRLTFEDAVGRRGGWSEVMFGRFAEVTDSDGTRRWAADPQAASVLGDWTQWLAVAEGIGQSGAMAQAVGAVVARSYVVKGTVIPPAPFSAQWVSEPDGVLRLSYNGKADNAQTAWLGAMDIKGDPNLTELAIEYTTAEDDVENFVETEFGLHFPEISDVKFRASHQLRMFVVATRRLPNDQGRWTAIDVDGFADGDVDVQEIEVGEELFALYDFPPTEARQFGDLLNSVELDADAARRVRTLKEDMAARLEGSGTAQGIAPVSDMIHPHGPVAAMRIIVDDSTVVFTEVIMANRDSADARWQRKRLREISRKREVGGVPLV